jgi:steroid delta-isomerase-like uncharacterized protein
MFRTCLAVTVLMIATSMAQSQVAVERGSTSMSMADTQVSNKHVVTELFEACFNHGDLERLPGLVAEEYQAPNGQTGPPAFTSTITQIRTTLTGLHYDVQDILAEGDRVAVRWRLAGTQDGPFRGFPPTHRKIETVGMAVFTLENGKIVRASILTDQLGFLQQIGALPREIKPSASPQTASPTTR